MLMSWPICLVWLPATTNVDEIWEWFVATTRSLLSDLPRNNINELHLFIIVLYQMVNTAIQLVIFVTKTMFYEMSFTLAKKCGRRSCYSITPVNGSGTKCLWVLFLSLSISFILCTWHTAVVDPAEWWHIRQEVQKVEERRRKELFSISIKN